MSELPFLQWKEGENILFWRPMVVMGTEIGCRQTSEVMGLRRKDLAAICRAPNGLCCEFSRRGADEQAILF